MSVYQHFREEEHSFVDQVIEWKEIVAQQYRPKLTDFLDPREQHICSQLIGKNDEVFVSFWGGTEQAERKRCLLYPSYFHPEKADYELAYFELEYPKKFVQIEHRDILGALMNVGLKREKFGDIITDGERFQFILAKEVADFVRLNLEFVGRAKVQLKELEEEHLIRRDVQYDKKDVTVPSLRLDAVISEGFQVSRSKAKAMIESRLVKVNWKIVDDASFSLMERDVISVRGKGRSVILQTGDLSKKGKRWLTLGFPK